MLMLSQYHQLIKQPFLLFRQLTFLPFLLLVLPPVVEYGDLSDAHESRHALGGLNIW